MEMSFAEQSLEMWVFVDEDNKIWLKANELAAFMGYEHERDAIRENVAEFNWRYWSDLKGVVSSSTILVERPSNWPLMTVFINEPGLHQLMFKSRRNDTESLQHWLVDEVLPTIRIDGASIGHIASATETQQQKLLDIIRQEQMANKRKDDDLRAQIAENRRKDDVILNMLQVGGGGGGDDDVKRPSTNDEMMAVYYNGIDPLSGLHSYTSIRCRKREEAKAVKRCTRPGSRSIFRTDSHNALNAFVRLRENLLPGFVYYANTLLCREAVEPIVILLNCN